MAVIFACGSTGHGGQMAPRGIQAVLAMAVTVQAPGRHKIDPEVRALIKRMCEENALWGAPGILSELKLLGFCVSERTVAKYMVRDRKPPSQTWRTFLENHV